MKDKNDTDLTVGRKFSPYPVIIVGLSLGALVGTYLLAMSPIETVAKALAFVGVVSLFLMFSVVSFYRQSKRRRATDDVVEDEDFDLGPKLLALDEACSFFAGTIKPVDAFRLACSRIRDLIPFSAGVLFLLDESRTRLVVTETDGAGTEYLAGRTFDLETELAGQCFSCGELRFDNYLSLDSSQKFGSTVAIPLCRGTDVFGVLQLYFDTGFDLNRLDQTIFEAVGTRVAPMMLGSIAFERTQSNALTDITTDLPNERAFYLVLEAQVAEAHRNNDIRPLTILAIDIKNFDEINQQYGHAAGDRILNFVAQIVKDNLRQMDFFARSLNDEFLAIMPTADKEISHEIISRIHTAFFGNKLDLNDNERVEIELNIGWASFGNDGETPSQLLNLAQLRKEQSKTINHQNVLWFPQETVN